MKVREVKWACDCGGGEFDVHLQGCAMMAAESRDSIDLEKLGRAMSDMRRMVRIAALDLPRRWSARPWRPSPHE